MRYKPFKQRNSCWIEVCDMIRACLESVLTLLQALAQTGKAPTELGNKIIEEPLDADCLALALTDQSRWDLEWKQVRWRTSLDHSRSSGEDLADPSCMMEPGQANVCRRCNATEIHVSGESPQGSTDIKVFPWFTSCSGSISKRPIGWREILGTFPFSGWKK